MLQSIKVDIAVKEQREYEMTHPSQVTVTVIHRAGGWNLAGGS